jgi:cytochrome b6-f complex iron-sulfur subunit
MRRRDFVRRLPVVSSGLVLGASSLSVGACGGMAYLTPTGAPGRLVVRRAQLDAEGQAFVQAPGMGRPVYLRRSGSGEVVALLASCTHNGCQPAPVGGRLVCPCHGSEFSLEGEVLEGPADRPLTRYEVTEDGAEVVIWLDREVGA